MTARRVIRGRMLRPRAASPRAAWEIDGTMPAGYMTRDGIRGGACPKCGDQMMLAAIKPSALGFDLRTFKCDVCHHTEKLTVATNSRKWRSSGLLPPA